MRALVVLGTLLLAGCAISEKPRSLVQLPGTASAPRNAVAAAPAVAAFKSTGSAAAALAAFRLSCPAFARREDVSGLTQAGDWAAPCDAAAAATDAGRFFASQFTPVTINGGKGFATGYFEPEIAGSRQRAPGYDVPLYRRPPDLIDVDLGRFAADLKGRKLSGQLTGTGLIPYPDRANIMSGSLAGKEYELAWAADPYEAFFLEIQGSGRLRLPDGSIMRIGFAGHNGRNYVAIGKILAQRGAFGDGNANMDAIMAWLRAHPTEAPALLAMNPSVVFFRELTGDGPIGALGVAVTPGVSVAADPAFIPLGAPVFVDTMLPGNLPLQAMMVAQDTGGAIKGANRLDLFRGAGATARAEAGSLAFPARVVVLIPKASAARLGLAP